MKKFIFVSAFLLFLFSSVYSVDMRNLQLSATTVYPGQVITITFEYYVDAWGKFAYYGAISNQNTIRSANTSLSEQQFRIRENCMDCSHAIVNGGRQSDQHSTAGWRSSSEIDENIYLTVSVDWSPGTYYIIIPYNNWNIYANPDSNHIGTKYVEITVIGQETATPTVTEIIEITNTYIPTPQLTPTIIITPDTPVYTYTPTETPTPFPFILSITYKPGSTETNIIKPYFRLYNTGTGSVKLNTLEVRYYYTHEGSSVGETGVIYSSQIHSPVEDITSSTNINIIQQDIGGQDSVISFTFDTGTLDPGHYVEVQAGVYNNDWSSYDQTNDWSYINTTEFIENTNMTVGILGAGTLSGNVPIEELVLPTCIVSDTSWYWDNAGVEQNVVVSTHYDNLEPCTKLQFPQATPIWPILGSTNPADPPGAPEMGCYDRFYYDTFTIYKKFNITNYQKICGTIKFAADDFAEIKINGNTIACGGILIVMPPGCYTQSCSMPIEIYFEDWVDNPSDGDFFRIGENEISITVTNGNYCSAWLSMQICLEDCWSTPTSTPTYTVTNTVTETHYNADFYNFADIFRHPGFSAVR